MYIAIFFFVDRVILPLCPFTVASYIGFKSVATFKNATLNDIEFKSHQYRVFIMNCTGEETNASQCPMKSNTSENQQHTQLLQISCSSKFIY